MKVMVTTNVEMDLDVTNNARREIVDIILHPDKPPVGDGPVVKLKYLPAYSGQADSHTSNTIGWTVIPVEPMTSTVKLQTKSELSGKILT